MQTLEICLLRQKCRSRSLDLLECKTGVVRINNINFDNYDTACAYLSSVPVNSATTLAMTQFIDRKKNKTRINPEMRAEAKILINLIDCRDNASVKKLRPILVDIANGGDLGAKCITPADVLNSVRRQLQPGF